MSDHTMCPGCHQLRYWTDFDARCSQCHHPTPSSGEEMESNPRVLEMAHVWLELRTLERKLVALEAGPQSPPTMASRTMDSPSGAEPCPICHLPQESGPHRRPMAPVLEPDSPLESTDPATPLSSPWGQHIMTFRVTHGCGSALPPLVDRDNRPLMVYCGMCGALLELEPIPVQAAPASPSGST
jgi:hypothetical protein